MPDIDDTLDDIEGQLADAQEDQAAALNSDSDSDADAQTGAPVPGAEKWNYANEAASGSVPAPISPAQATGMSFNAPGTNVPPVSVQNYIAQRLAAQNAGLKAAQSKSNEDQAIASVTEGLGQVAAGAARSNTFNPASYQSLHQNAQAPIQNFLEQQKAKGQELAQIGQEEGTSRQLQMADPNSLQSHVAQGIVSSQLQKYFPDVDPSFTKGLSANDLHDFLEKPIDQAQAGEYRTEIAKLRMQGQKDAAAERAMMMKGQKDQSQLASAQHNLDTDKEFGDAKTKMNDVDRAIDLANQARNGNGEARNLLGPLLIPTITGLKRVNETELKAAAGSPDVVSTAQRWIQKLATGGMTKADYDNVMNVLSVAKKGANAQYSDTAGRHITQYSRLSGKSPEEAAYSLGIDLPNGNTASSGPTGAGPQIPSPSWTPDKEARLQELLKKQQEGTLDATK